MIKRIILVSGTRQGVKDSLIYRTLNGILKNYNPKEVVLIHGGARGVDTQADEWCRYHGVHPIKCDALWNSYERWVAGPLRNEIMIQLVSFIQQLINILNSNKEAQSPIDLKITVEAFPPSGEKGGTRHAIKLSKQYNLAVNVHESE